MPRFTGWLVFSLGLCVLIYHLAPHQLPITAYKVSLATLGGVLGYWLSRGGTSLRMHELLDRGEAADSVIGGMLIYRGLCISGGMLALSLGA